MNIRIVVSPDKKRAVLRHAFSFYRIAFCAGVISIETAADKKEQFFEVPFSFVIDTLHSARWLEYRGFVKFL